MGIRPATLFATGVGLFALGVVLPKLVSVIDRSPARSAGPLMPIDLNTSVDVIVPAYLESSVIGDTIAHIRATTVDHPGRLRVLVIASDPETAAAARAAGADIVIDAGRRGKAAAINAGAEMSDADLIVLTDANCRIHPSDWLGLTIESLKRHAAVSGNKREAGGHESAFWRIEEWIKRGSGEGIETLSLVGEYICLRRSDFTPIPEGAILDDYRVARDLARGGKSTIVHPQIYTEEDPTPPREQWRRRVRIAEGVLEEVLPDAPWLACTRVGRLQLAHKVYRMSVGCVGFWLAILGAASLFPPASLVVLPSAALAVLAYAGRLGSFSGGPIATLVGMQAVPVAGAVTLIRRTASGARPAGWEKAVR